MPDSSERKAAREAAKSLIEITKSQIAGLQRSVEDAKKLLSKSKEVLRRMSKDE